MRRLRPLITGLIAAALMLSGLSIAPVMAQTQDCGGEYTVEPGDTLSEIAALCEVTYSDLLAANPHIDNPRLIYPGQIITIPGGNNGGDSGTIPVTGGSLYIVKPGDTLSAIASRFRVSPQEMMGANPWLQRYNTVYPGMRLTLPRGAQAVPTLTVSPTVGDAETTVTIAATGFQADTPILIGFGRISGPYYQVSEETTDANGALVREVNIPDWAGEARGDYVFVAQNRSNPNIRALSNRFNLTDGQPGPGIPTTGGPTVRTYTVKSGDTLFEIAQMHNTSLDALLDLNPSIDEASVIYPGQTIQLPVGTRPAGPYIMVSSPRVAPGGDVRVQAFNFPGNAFVDIRLAPDGERYIRPYDARTNERGNLNQTIRLPQNLDSGTYRIIVTTTERRTVTRAISDPFEVQSGITQPGN